MRGRRQSYGASYVFADRLVEWCVGSDLEVEVSVAEKAMSFALLPQFTSPSIPMNSGFGKSMATMIDIKFDVQIEAQLTSKGGRRRSSLMEG